jgi:hypothetical protein
VVPRAALPICFLVDDRPVAGETLHVDAGAQVLVLTSCSAELGIELRSAYLGGQGRDELLVAESAVLGAGPAEFFTRRIDDSGDVHTYERRSLLYDHLQRLQDIAAAAGRSLAFEGVGDAAAQFDPLSPASP